MMQRRLRTLLVGGSGFIGTALLRRLLLEGGRDLIVMGRSRQPRHLLPPDVTYLQGDAADRDFLDRVLEGVDEVIDLAYATVPKTSFDDPLYDVVANLSSNVALLQLASRRPLRRFLLVSSGGTVYGHPEQLPIPESHATVPISPYGISKLVGEKYAHFFQQTAGLPMVIVRPSNPYGVAQVGGRLQGFVGAAIGALRQERAITVFGERGTLRDYMHVDDLADALALCLVRGKVGATYNIGSGVGTDNLHVIDKLRPLAEADGLKVCVQHLPLRSFDVRANVLDASLLRADTGWQPRISLDQGLAEVWRSAKISP